MIGKFYGATVETEPRDAKIRKGRTFRIVNKDKILHEFGLSFTSLARQVEPEQHWDVDTNDLPNIGTWGITCDGINLKTGGATLVLLDAF